MAAELAQWRRMSAGSRAARRRKRPSCARVKAMSSPSASAKWVKTPVRRTSGLSLSASSTAATSASVLAPMRPMPVSSFRCTRPCLPKARAASCIQRTMAGSHTVMVRPSAAPRRAASGVVAPSTSTGTSPMPACRRAAPSSAVATARCAAPASMAARATCTMPWPYASALTTASKRVPSGRASRRSLTLPRSASRSTVRS